MNKLFVTAIAAMLTLTLFSCEKKSTHICHCLVITPGTTDTITNYTAEYEGVTKKQAQKNCDQDKADFESVWLGVNCDLN